MLVLIMNNGGRTEERYKGVLAEVIVDNKDSPYMEVRPSEQRCDLLTGNILVDRKSVMKVKN